jgi:hypothetical protein
MALTLPNLDDRTYAELTQEAQALIPTYAPEWSNRNPSDPGITLVELFCYLTEMLLFRVNRVTDDNVKAFLKLLNGPAWQPPTDPGRLGDEVRHAVQDLRRSYRAVTAADFEALALEADPGVAKARCVPRRNLEEARGIDKPGHVSVIIVPAVGGTPPQPSDALKQVVAAFLDGRRLLTTRVHVVGPQYVKISVTITLFLLPDAKEADVRARAVAGLTQFFDPIRGGMDDQGWPFGRSVHTSEIYELLGTLAGVDYVQRSADGAGNPLDELACDPPDATRLVHNSLGGLETLVLHLDELPNAQINATDLALASPSQS